MSKSLQSLQIIRPDDWHVHLREGTLLRHVLPETSAVFGRAVAMPNLSSPVDTVRKALNYKRQIVEALPPDHKNNFEPLMTLYLTESTSAKDILEAKSAGIFGIKYYPKGATNLSEKGIHQPKSVFHVFEAMEEQNIPLLIHGEVVDSEVDVFDLEKAFVGNVLPTIVKNFPTLKVTLEHLSTKEAVQFVREHAPQLGGSITVHHLLLNRNDLLFQGLNVHHYCMPIVKTEQDRRALVSAATSGEPCFFLGTDSAPHLERHKKQFGRPGIYTAPVALPLATFLFEEEGALGKLESFCSLNGAGHYGMKPNPTTLTLVKKPFRVAEKIPIQGNNKNEHLVPFQSATTIPWQVQKTHD